MISGRISVSVSVGVRSRVSIRIRVTGTVMAFDIHIHRGEEHAEVLGSAGSRSVSGLCLGLCLGAEWEGEGPRPRVKDKGWRAEGKR